MKRPKSPASTDETPNKKTHSSPVKKKREPPKNWEIMLSKIEDFRGNNLAPVDTIGCERLGKSTIPSVRRYEILTSLQLSSQTKDEVTAAAIANLQNSENGLNIDSIIKMSEHELDSYISKVGFHVTKSKHIKRTAQILKDNHGSDVPKTLEELLALPGIGPKMAHLTLQACWDITAGIGVDTHVHRISNRMGWVNTSTAIKTQKELEEWLPLEHWKSLNSALVGFGQIHCMPVKPKCFECPIKNLCPKIGTKKLKD